MDFFNGLSLELGITPITTRMVEKRCVINKKNSDAPFLCLGFSNPIDEDEEGDSSLSRVKGKRERDHASNEAEEDEDGSHGKKKLRLTKEQSALLEETFNLHSTLNHSQKLAIAKLLNLRPRKVEVWFQNRRARTKLKKTEVDCEFLKKCCETLSEENRRLQKEVYELRALKFSQSYLMHTPVTTLAMCPSCDGIAKGNKSNFFSNLSAPSAAF